MSAVSPGDRYVAMGSSFAAGPGLRPRADGSPRTAGRSAVNYAHLVAERLDLALTDMTFSGATAAEMLRPGALGQTDAVTPDTRLVTVTAGGNDVGYLPGLFSASLPRVASVAPSIRHRRTEIRDAATLEGRFAQLDESLSSLVAGIRDRAPDSDIVLVDYLTILPADPTVDTAPLPAPTAQWGRNVARCLAALTRRIADERGCRYVAASDLSRGHDAWSPEPWTRKFHYTLRGGAPYHPTSAGMAAVASSVVESVTADRT